MRRELKDRYGTPIGYVEDESDRNTYYCHRVGMIGWYDKHTQWYFATGYAGTGMIAQSDIGSGEVHRVWQEVQ